MGTNWSDEHNDEPTAPQWWAGTDYAVAYAVMRQLGKHARHSVGYGPTDHDGECTWATGQGCEACERQYRIERWHLYRAAKAVAVGDGWDVGAWNEFCLTLVKYGQQFWD